MEDAGHQLIEFEATWNEESAGPVIVAAGLAMTDRVFRLHAEIRKVIDIANAIESVNMILRKITKNRGSFPSDEALLKLFHLALRNITKKWTMPIRDWKTALNRFTIQFEERHLQQ